MASLRMHCCNFSAPGCICRHGSIQSMERPANWRLHICLIFVGALIYVEKNLFSRHLAQFLPPHLPPSIGLLGQVRATGPVNPLTRQPVKGRKKKGGVRFGEMERDALLSHGAAFLLHDRLMNCSDRHVAHVCARCGGLLTTASRRAPQEAAGQSGPAAAAAARRHIWCSACKSSADVHAVALPYVFRYLVNELAGMNIKVSLTLS
ncbi:unnamed protein product [Phaeothamnion confervicola]